MSAISPIFRAMEISDLIRVKRQEAGLSQAALAEKLAVNKSAVAQWELGTTTPTNQNMTSLKQILNFQDPVELSPGAPYSGQLVEDGDELALLSFWRSLSVEERRTAARLLNIHDLTISKSR